jgi:hypothetical protein
LNDIVKNVDAESVIHAMAHAGKYLVSDTSQWGKRSPTLKETVKRYSDGFLVKDPGAEVGYKIQFF